MTVTALLFVSQQTDKDEDSEEVKVQKVKVQEMGCVQTDFGAKDAYQKVVRFTALGSKVVTGGMDGVVRVWKVSNVRCIGHCFNDWLFFAASFLLMSK